ncbi:hypothetical protein HZI73_26145 (plasmid) [Vallitalea pronyensis]|uniref:Uncharacterized protein n=1 Tax=Vallitalea pronyensis TaxID=1348613 RepID=A0A8J8MQW2_9FIRM|nr:hypothetical protein [Vallitalea pronyensis]QUI25896.1 hypothetical protein HZI73_26145 [Vallitalea pronyensis]
MQRYKKRIGSCKLNRAIIDYKLEALTSIDIDVLLLLGKYQDAFGKVKYIYYKEIIDKLNIHKTSYYRALRHLSEQNIIEVDLGTKETYKDLRFIDNDYSNEYNEKVKNYFNINHHLLYTSEFRNLRKNAKVGLIRIIANMNRYKGFMNIGNGKLKQYFNTSNIYLIRTYIEDIKQFITVKHNDSGSLTLFYKEVREGSIRDLFLSHIFMSKMKINKIVHSLSDIRKLIKTFNIFISREAISDIYYLIEELTKLVIRYQDKGFETKIYNKILNSRYGY